jgi:hypothetical protein
MLGGLTPITTVLGAAPAPDADTATIKSFARAAASIGLHLLLIEPGGKKPVDMRSPVQRRTDDGLAKDEARAEGRADWDRVKSRGGVFLATANTRLLDRYIDRYRKTYGEDTPVNFGVAVGPSKLIVVDCDTAEQVAAFLSDFGADPNTPPTVRSPGQRDAEGNWAHSDGGHFYFTTETIMPEQSGSLTGPGGYAVLWANRYVLIPPSVRPEGPYRLVGQDFPAPERLIQAVKNAAFAKVQARMNAEVSPEVATAVDTWAQTVTWGDILAPSGWSLAARQDNCGCDIWTAPGDHASPKSATAHDTACSLGRYTPENAPLHIWTDNPGPELEAWIAERGTKTLSRLQAVAALEYGGNVGTAMRELSVMPDDSGALAFGRDLADEIGAPARNLDEPLAFESGGQTKDYGPRPDAGVSGAAEPVAGTFTLSGPGGEQTLPYDAPGEQVASAWQTVASSPYPADLFVNAGSLPPEAAPEEEQITGVPHIMPFAHWREYPAPEFVIDGLLEHRALTAVIGAPGVGKSGAVLDMAASIALGRRWMGRETLRQRVLYLPGEGLSGAVQRLLAWESAHDLDVGDDLLVGDSIIQVAASSQAWAAVIQKMLEFEVGLIIIDTFARASVGLEENSATDVGKAIRRFDDVRKATGSGLMVVHHTAKSSSSGRGSSALNGALDTELLIEEGNWWDDEDGVCPGRPLSMRVTKQKNAAAPENGVAMIAVPFGNSFIMTGPSGLVDDPLDVVGTVRAIIPEPLVSVAIRCQEFAARFRGQGITRSELAYGVPMDDYTNGRRDAKTAWRLKVAEAIDLGIRYGLLETFTGQATGARYIDGPCGPDAARERWAAEALND